MTIPTNSDVRSSLNYNIKYSYIFRVRRVSHAAAPLPFPTDDTGKVLFIFNFQGVPRESPALAGGDADDSENQLGFAGRQPAARGRGQVSAGPSGA